MPMYDIAKAAESAVQWLGKKLAYWLARRFPNAAMDAVIHPKALVLLVGNFEQEFTADDWRELLTVVLQSIDEADLIHEVLGDADLTSLNADLLAQSLLCSGIEQHKLFDILPLALRDESSKLKDCYSIAPVHEFSYTHKYVEPAIETVVKLHTTKDGTPKLLLRFVQTLTNVPKEQAQLTNNFDLLLEIDYGRYADRVMAMRARRQL